MIRRRVEYIIHCDAERIGRECAGDGSAHAFNSETSEECAESAKKDGWKQISKRFWLCPKCVVSDKLDKQVSNG